MKSDRDKWEERYVQTPEEYAEPDEFLTIHRELLRPPGRALDLACGRGAESLWLAAHGYTVDAFDISFTALGALRATAVSKGLPIHAAAVDLDDYPLATDVYDLVIVFNFWIESLPARIDRALKRGGLVIYSTFNQTHTSVQPTFNPAYLLPNDGLMRGFTGYDILVYEPSTGERGGVSRIICRKP
jgi:SAM-dependent methyltransferase